MNPRQHAISVLEFARWYTNNLLKDLPESKWLHQPSPTDNHVLWCIGHFAGTNVWAAKVLDIPGVIVSQEIQTAYGMGSKPSQTGNPSLEEVKRAFQSSHEAVMAWLKSAPDSSLAGDISEKTGKFASDPLDMMMKLAWHEGFHAGQIANVRKALGLPPTM